MEAVTIIIQGRMHPSDVIDPHQLFYGFTGDQRFQAGDGTHNFPTNAAVYPREWVQFPDQVPPPLQAAPYPTRQSGTVLVNHFYRGTENSSPYA